MDKYMAKILIFLLSTFFSLPLPLLFPTNPSYRPRSLGGHPPRCDEYYPDEATPSTPTAPHPPSM